MGSHSCLARCARRIARKGIYAIPLLALIAAVWLLSAPGGVPIASAANQCGPATAIQNNGQGQTTETATAASGQIITQVWVVSGNDAAGQRCTEFTYPPATQTDARGCYSVTGLGTSTVTVTKVGGNIASNGTRCQGISHLEYLQGPAPATPTITTQLSPASPVHAGTSVQDTATLSGGNAPTGHITFNVYSGSDCSATPLFTSTATVNGNGNYQSSSFTFNTAGTYNFVASYSGDSNNNAVSSGCGSESLTVNQALPPGPCGSSNSPVAGGTPGTGTFLGPLGQSTTLPATTGTTQDYFNSCSPNGSKITNSGTSPDAVTALCAYVGPVDAAPQNQFSLALYADNSGTPGNLIANTAVGTLTADSWNCLPLSASLSPGTSYWVMLWTNSMLGSTSPGAGTALRNPCPDNASSGADDNSCYVTASSNVGAYWYPASLTTFGSSTSWSSLTGNNWVLGPWAFSVVAIVNS